VAEIFVLAVLSAFWPALLAVALVSLRAPHPPRLLSSFLAGGLLTTLSIGLAIIYALSSVPDASRGTLDAAFFIVAGVLALVAAAILRKRYGAAPRSRPPRTGPSRTERLLERGVALAFVAGILFNIVPGFLPFVALKDIAELDYAFPATFAVLLGFYLIMFTLIEAPLLGYLIAPERAVAATERVNDWVDRNAVRAAIYALAGIGIYLLVRGIVAAI
jgi:hypothetical protein